MNFSRIKSFLNNFLITVLLLLENPLFRETAVRKQKICSKNFHDYFCGVRSCQTLSGPLPRSGSPAREARGATTAAPQGAAFSKIF